MENQQFENRDKNNLKTFVSYADYQGSNARKGNDNFSNPTFLKVYKLLDWDLDWEN